MSEFLQVYSEYAIVVKRMKNGKTLIATLTFDPNMAIAFFPEQINLKLRSFKSSEIVCAKQWF